MKLLALDDVRWSADDPAAVIAAPRWACRVVAGEPVAIPAAWRRVAAEQRRRVAVQVAAWKDDRAWARGIVDGTTPATDPWARDRARAILARSRPGVPRFRADQYDDVSVCRICRRKFYGNSRMRTCS